MSELKGEFVLGEKSVIAFCFQTTTKLCFENACAIGVVNNFVIFIQTTAIVIESDCVVLLLKFDDSF